MSDAEFSYSKYLGTLFLLIFPSFGESLTRYENHFRGLILNFNIKSITFYGFCLDFAVYIYYLL